MTFYEATLTTLILAYVAGRVAAYVWRRIRPTWRNA
jgi:hypothetical protein